MELDAVGFIVRGVVKTQYPGPIRLTRVMLQVLSEPTKRHTQQLFTIHTNTLGSVKTNFDHTKIAPGMSDAFQGAPNRLMRSSRPADLARKTKFIL